jgi:4-hydroxy-3-methylbut-2-enyl diphosphate reductase
MKIKIIKPIAHCFGVVNAINLAKKVAREYKNKNIFIFGLLVHNDFIKEELEKINVKSLDVSNIDPIKKLKDFTSDDVVIFSAHGHDLKYEGILKENNVTFFDATCEKVKVAFDYIKKSDEVIYIGKMNHPETKAALTMNSNAHLYDISKSFDYSLIKSDNPVVINQTTLSFLELKEIHEDIKIHIPNAKIIDEICNATLLRQKAVSTLEDEIDLVLIVGSKKSSNTMKLFEVAKKNNPTKNVLFVENIRDLEGFSLNYKYCAIASGTSTPFKIIEEIKTYLENK